MRSLFFALFLFASTAAQAFVDPPTFTPATPNSAQAVTASVRHGVCHFFLAPGPGIPPRDIVVTPGVVDIFEAGVIIVADPFCNIPISSIEFNLGTLPADTYQVRVWILDEDSDFQAILVSSASLVVSHAPTQPIPALSTPALALMVLCVLAMATWFMRRSRVLLLVGLLTCTTVHAQSEPPMLMVLLAISPTAPWPDELVEPLEFSAGYLGMLSPGLIAENPTRAYYLLPKRARGDQQMWLEANPDDPRAKLERFVLIAYPPAANLQNALAALAADPNIVFAAEAHDVEFATPPALSVLPAPPRQGPKQLNGTPQQGWINSLGLDRAWEWAGGWSLVATMDNGLNTTHPDLIAFDPGGAYTGGNFLPTYSADVGRATGVFPAQLNIDPNVDERQPVATTGGACDPDLDNLMVPTFAGHGTHVAGLIGANAGNADTTVGACKHCGLAAWRVARESCASTGIVGVRPRNIASAAALTYIGDLGFQVVNQSFGEHTDLWDYCVDTSPNHPWCLAITKAHQRGILMVGASGNHRTTIQFPAEDRRVVAVGGVEPDLSFWDDRLDLPVALLSGECPDPALGGVAVLGNECGSNFTQGQQNERRQEIAVPARDIYSTMYPGVNWNEFIECGDGFDDANAADGRGGCSGTSMSAPLYSGLAGLLRSINPLVMPGDPENPIDAIGVRDVIVESAMKPGGQAWSPQFGYGIPDTEVAARIMLGTVGGQTVKNRLTPLFSMYSAGATDHAYVTVPQAAVSLAISQASNYTSSGALVEGYPLFPDSAAATPPAPRANIFVLTTEFRTNPQHPNLLPLYWMDRTRNFPLGCTPGSGCNTDNRDFLLFTTAAEIETAYADGFAFRGLQGYVYGRCSPEPSCIPLGAEKLYRKCNLADDDCTVFLENERVAMEAAGYTSAYPAGSNMHIGYAYRNVDSDSDGLINGLEQLIGTKPFNTDSDGDGLGDGVEFPLAGISMSDPCDGPNVQCDLATLFSDSFE